MDDSLWYNDVKYDLTKMTNFFWNFDCFINNTPISDALDIVLPVSVHKML